MHHLLIADARRLPLPDDSVDLVVTSPPYWQKRDYGVRGQIGQEPTLAEYVTAIMDCLNEWRRVLTPMGSVMLNVGDTYRQRSLAGVPGRIEAAAQEAGWLLRNRIIWSKARGVPDPVKDRLAGRHEYVLHLVPQRAYYYDLVGYAQEYGSGANPGDVWSINPSRGQSHHLAPFPVELARRAILLACPERVCSVCGMPSTRIVERTVQLDPSRPQARRAMELAEEAGLTPEHIAAVQATGISDAGKALHVQSGTGRNAAAVQRLAAEAKSVLGGYFREFACSRKVTTGWSDCGHGSYRAGRVLDPFSGSGTSGVAAGELGRDYLGVDLDRRCHAISARRKGQLTLMPG